MDDDFISSLVTEAPEGQPSGEDKFAREDGLVEEPKREWPYDVMKLVREGQEIERRDSAELDAYLGRVTVEMHESVDGEIVSSKERFALDEILRGDFGPKPRAAAQRIVRNREALRAKRERGHSTRYVERLVTKAVEDTRKAMLLSPVVSLRIFRDPEHIRRMETRASRRLSI